MELSGQDARVVRMAGAYDAANERKRFGGIAEALAIYRDVLKRAGEAGGPDGDSLAAAALREVSLLADAGLSDAEMAAGEALAARAAAGSEAAWTVRFALGHGQAALGDPAAAMAWFDAGNAMKRADVAYDADAMDRYFDAVIEAFDGETIQRLARFGARSAKPVFVVGMPRSGTTLAEQVLASAPRVHGAGELTTISKIVAETRRRDGCWPEGAANLAPARVMALGSAYLSHIHGLAPEADRVIDKMPGNALALGLIMGLLPKATIIHMRRDPLDACFGCYRQLFSGQMNYCYDQHELGRYHAALDRVMAHWEAIAPGRIIEVEYARLVQDFEAEARRMLAGAGIPWSDACLEFHKTDRAIDTASAKQARQPLFTSGLGAAEPYRPYLAPLEAALAA